GPKQPRARYLRQAGGVVDDVDQHVLAVARHNDVDTAFAELLRWDLLDSFRRILDDAGDGLRDQPAVELRAQRVFLESGFDLELGVRDLHQEHRLPYGVDD